MVKMLFIFCSLEVGTSGMERRLFIYSRISLCSAEAEGKSQWTGTTWEIWDQAWVLSQGHWVLHFSGLQIIYISAEQFEVDNV
jgi:hypothetical protein